MELFVGYISMGLLAALAVAQITDEGPCFEFPGDSYLQFTPNTFDNNNNIHYRLAFKTTEENGVILYSRGLEGDYEALFLQNGKLRYFLFNTSPTGVEGYFGGYFEGNERVDIGQWIKVKMFRVWTDGPQRRKITKTGFEVEVNGVTSKYSDDLVRRDITLQPTVYLGGYRDSLSSTVRNFTGQIKDIYEEKNGYLFENPSVNYMSKVSLSCTDALEPN